MGAAVSSNIVNAVTTVTSSVQNQTSANSTQTNACVNNINLDGCVIDGNLTINESCNIIATSQNIISQITSNNLNSTVSQKLAQEAASTVGALGLGFAEATNTANAFVNSASNIVNSVSSSAHQNASSISNFNCSGGTIINGNTIFNISNDQNFLSQQVLQNQSTNQIVQNISQDVTQKATATVQGMAGLIIAFAILIAAVGWVLLKPLQIATSSKILVIFIVILIIISILTLMYVKQWPPFFRPPTSCIGVKANVGGCGTNDCVDTSVQTITIPAAPIRYSFDIIGQNDADPGSFKPGLLQMSISKHGGWGSPDASGQGGGQAAYDYFASAPEFAGLPNPLVKNGNAWETNISGPNGWQTYISNPQNAGHARFVLATDLQLETYARIFPYEECIINGKVYSDDTHCYNFVPNVAVNNVQFAVNSGGQITGQFGYCNTPLYRIRNIVKIGGLVLIALLIIVFIVVILMSHKGSKSSSGTASSGKGSGSSGTVSSGSNGKITTKFFGGQIKNFIA